MGRPIKLGLDYFSHDTDASSDEKVEALRALYRNDGYAFYFIHLERLYRSNTGELNLSSIEERKILAKKIGITLKRYETILKSCFKINLFDEKKFFKNGSLSSAGIKKRFLQIQAERKRKRKYYERSKGVLDVQNGGRNYGENAGEMDGETLQSKVKKSKVIELAESLITDIKKETSLYSTIGKYKKQLTEEKLTSILNDCINRSNSFIDENKLAAYLQACTRNNNELISDSHHSFNPIEIIQ
jgi:hypothetical protein